jgi:hypothetical protein
MCRYIYICIYIYSYIYLTFFLGIEVKVENSEPIDPSFTRVTIVDDDEVCMYM